MFNWNGNLQIIFSYITTETEVRKTERNCLIAHFLCSAMNALIVCIEMFSRKNGNAGNCHAASRNRLADFLIAFSYLLTLLYDDTVGPIRNDAIKLFQLNDTLNN